MIKAIVLDDEWYSMEEVCGFAEKTGFIHVVGKYIDPLKALEEVHVLCPQVAFIDIEMPGMDGLTFAEHLLKINPEVMLVFITSWSRYAVQAFELNALDYVMKPIKEERFQKLVERLRAEISRNEHGTDAERILSLYGGTKNSLTELSLVHLSERETQVLKLLSQGLTQREIAAELYFSVSSVKTHLGSIYTKLRVNNKISAVQRAREAGIL